MPVASFSDLDKVYYYCHMPSLSVQNIYFHDNTILSISNLKACLLWQLPSLQHTYIVVMQQSRDSIFYNGNTPI